MQVRKDELSFKDPYFSNCTPQMCAESCRKTQYPIIFKTPSVSEEKPHPQTFNSLLIINSKERKGGVIQEYIKVIKGSGFTDMPW